MSVVGRSPNVSNSNVDPLLGRFPNKLDNVLKNFESVTYRMSFGCVSREEYNTASYLNDGLEDQRALVIGESGYTGAPINSFAASTGEAIPNVGNRVVTAYGAPEFFIDNLKFTHYLPGSRSVNTGLAKVTFDVLEPYSMGLFFNSMLGAALKKGHTHFSDEHCCYVMRIDFMGHSNGTPNRIPQATKYIPLRVANISFTANESGGKYSVTCLEFGSSNTTSNVVSGIPGQANITIDNDDVGVTLSGLARTFNLEQVRLLNQNQITLANEYRVVLGDISDVRVSGGYTTNPPGWEDMSFDIRPDDPGNRTYINPEDYDPSGVNLRLATGGRQFVYNGSADGARTTIFTVIDDIMCHTTYARTSRENEQDGFIWWWTIQTSQEAIGTQIDPRTNRRPTIYTYRVVPYRVHISQFRAPTVVLRDAPSTISKIRKVFSYTYTGQNDDILSYDMNFNNLFYLATNVRSWNEMRAAAETSTVGESEVNPANPGEGNTQAVTSLASTYYSYPDPNSLPANPGGAGVDSPAIMINRWLNGTINGGRNRTNPSGGAPDLVQLELTLKITGDPYFIPIGGFGNQREGNDLNSMAWEGEQVRIYVRFRTIVDAPPQGSSLYIQRLNGQKDHPFSGVYRVLKVQSMFADGKFEQTLKLYRDLTTSVEDSNGLTETAGTGTGDTVFIQDAIGVPASSQASVEGSGENSE